MLNKVSILSYLVNISWVSFWFPQTDGASLDYPAMKDINKSYHCQTNTSIKPENNFSSKTFTAASIYILQVCLVWKILLVTFSLCPLKVILWCLIIPCWIILTDWGWLGTIFRNLWWEHCIHLSRCLHNIVRLEMVLIEVKLSHTLGDADSDLE